MPRPIRLGILVPSSNTALEPLTTSILSGLPHVTAHFSRFPVTEIALSESALAQFDDSKILSASRLLADANVDMIGWSGTSAGWLGLEADRTLCQRIEEATGIKATTSVLGLNKVLEDLGLGCGEGIGFGLVTPYLDDVQEKIQETFKEQMMFDVDAESHLGKCVNVEFADIDETTLDSQVDAVVRQMNHRGDRKMIVSTFCTNLKAAQRVHFWEQKYPTLIVADTVATVIWHMLRLLGEDTRQVKGWGKIFAN